MIELFRIKSRKGKFVNNYDKKLLQADREELENEKAQLSVCK